MKKTWCLFLILIACLLWGMTFVVPQFLASFTPLELALGRFFCFGLLSFVLLMTTRRELIRSLPLKIWGTALLFCLVMNYGYYSTLSLGLRYSNPSVITLLIGVSPISIAFYGNWLQKEGHGKKLIVPSLLIFLGLIFINMDSLFISYEIESTKEYMIGLGAGLFALGAWTWFAVANARFLRKHPQIDPREWTSLMGIVTFFCSMLGIMVLFALSEREYLEKFSFQNPEFIQFIIGSLVTAVCCSWIAYSLWNYASLSVPLSLMGQLAIFETIFGLIFVYMFEGRFPTYYEVAGISIIMVGIFVGISMLNKTKTA